jgi:hypothetical protein
MTVKQLAAWCAEAEKRYGENTKVVIASKFLGKHQEIAMYYTYSNDGKSEPVVALLAK